MSRYNIRKSRPDAPLQPSDVRPRGEVYSADFLSAFWPEEERKKKAVPEPQASAENVRHNIRKPRTDNQFDPTDRRPKSEMYSADFLQSFWPEEDKTMPARTGRKVRKGARSFVEHDNSCQWMEYMKQPAEQPESLHTGPSDNTHSSMFPKDISADYDNQQGDFVNTKPGSDVTNYLREQRLSCSPEKGTVYLKETTVRPFRRMVSPKKPVTNASEKPADQKPHQTPGQTPGQVAEKGTVEWYQSQMSLLEEQQRSLMKQQQNLIAIMSSHQDLSSQQQHFQQMQHQQHHQQNQQQQHPGQVHSSDSVISTNDDVTLSLSHHDVASHRGHVTSGVESDCSLALHGECSNNNVAANIDESPQLHVHRLRQTSARSRKYEEGRSRDIRLSMSGHMAPDIPDRDDHQFPERQGSSTSQCSRLSHGSDQDFPPSRRCGAALVVKSDTDQLKEPAPVTSSQSDVTNFGETGSVFREPRRGIRLKGHSAAANAVRNEGSLGNIIYYRRHSVAGEVEEPQEETKIYDMNQPLERSKSSVKASLTERSYLIGGSPQSTGSAHWMKAPSSTSISDCCDVSPRDHVTPSSPTHLHTSSSVGNTPFSRQATPTYKMQQR